MTGGALAVEVHALGKRYGDVVAADDVSFEVRRGEIFGIVGPNGAGKTTIVECLMALRRPDVGRVRVLGLDPRRDAAMLRARIGAQLQSAALPERLKAWEAVDLFASLYRRAGDWRALLRRVDLFGRADVSFGCLSGGQKQRLFVALALINDPEVVLFDELAASVDPAGRLATWDLVRDVRDRGATVLLTTHFMEEAERLCDRVAIVNRGRVVALDSPAQLVRDCGGGHRVSFRVEGPLDVEALSSLGAVVRVERVEDRVIVEGRHDGLAVDVLTTLATAGVRCRDFRTDQPTLEDAFLALTRTVRAEAPCVGS